ncbi:response regulator transcription factor [Undibacterium terreum]|uniref:DNA-binding response regulator n=1 Tax=Undibacterium terreum TaxID=1224302 RepID=A0A916XHZ2_9BURK|nr:response regulator transcription factor [Undibacterium terreum]GGC74832.1 DNA-binding response regulator [Undibacterium terreum]
MHIIDKTNVIIQYQDPLVAVGLLSTLSQRPEFLVSLMDDSDACLSVNLSRTPGCDAAVIVADYDSAMELLMANPDSLSTRKPVPLNVLIVTWRNTEAEIRAALDAGARGYVIGNCALCEIVNAVQSISRGSRYLGRDVAERIADSLTHTPLTSREIQVLQLMASGCPNKTIAARLNIALGTVKTHTKSILGKLHSTSRTHAALIAQQRGLLTGNCKTAHAAARGVAASTPVLSLSLVHSRQQPDLRYR